MSERSVRGSDLVGLTEIGERCGVVNSAVANWRERYADFPEPFATVSFGSVWDWREVRSWATLRGKLTD